MPASRRTALLKSIEDHTGRNDLTTLEWFNYMLELWTWSEGWPHKITEMMETWIPSLPQDLTSLGVELLEVLSWFAIEFYWSTELETMEYLQLAVDLPNRSPEFPLGKIDFLYAIMLYRRSLPLDRMAYRFFRAQCLPAAGSYSREEGVQWVKQDRKGIWENLERETKKRAVKGGVGNTRPTSTTIDEEAAPETRAPPSPPQRPKRDDELTYEEKGTKVLMDRHGLMYCRPKIAFAQWS